MFARCSTPWHRVQDVMVANACDLEREFYLIPTLATETIEMCGPWNGHTATLAAEGAGIAATIFAFVDIGRRTLGQGHLQQPSRIR